MGLANVFVFAVGRVTVGTRPLPVSGAPMFPALMGVCATVGT